MRGQLRAELRWSSLVTTFSRAYKFPSVAIIHGLNSFRPMPSSSSCRPEDKLDRATSCSPSRASTCAETCPDDSFTIVSQSEKEISSCHSCLYFSNSLHPFDQTASENSGTDFAFQRLQKLLTRYSGDPERLTKVS